jgi:hypothetical protein
LLDKRRHAIKANQHNRPNQATDLNKKVKTSLNHHAKAAASQVGEEAQWGYSY